MDSLFGHDILKRALISDYEIIAIWGAFHILKMSNEEIRPYLVDFLNSPFADIQDAGISKISEMEALESEWKGAEEMAAIMDGELTEIPGFDEFRQEILDQDE